MCESLIFPCKVEDKSVKERTKRAEKFICNLFENALTDIFFLIWPKRHCSAGQGSRSLSSFTEKFRF